MKWVLAGLAFALAVGLAIGTAAIRAENTRERYRLEIEYRMVQDRVLEARRLAVATLQDGTPEKLAAALRELLKRQREREAQQWD